MNLKQRKTLFNDDQIYNSITQQTYIVAGQLNIDDFNYFWIQPHNQPDTTPTVGILSCKCWLKVNR